jgi:hypothetical protein
MAGTGLNEAAREDIRALLNEVLDSRRSIDEETHLADHQWIRGRVMHEQRAAERAEKIKAQVGGWAAIGLLTGIGYTVWEWLKGHLH